MSPPEQDGTCCDEGDDDTKSRRFWAKALARIFVFGSLLLVSAVILAGIYLVVKVLK